VNTSLVSTLRLLLPLPEDDEVELFVLSLDLMERMVITSQSSSTSTVLTAPVVAVGSRCTRTVDVDVAATAPAARRMFVRSLSVFRLTVLTDRTLRRVLFEEPLALVVPLPEFELDSFIVSFIFFCSLGSMELCTVLVDLVVVAVVPSPSLVLLTDRLTVFLLST